MGKEGEIYINRKLTRSDITIKRVDNMKQNKLTWKIGGKAGEGIMATGIIFSQSCSRGGLHVYDINEYPSLIKGGHNNI